MTKNNYVKGNFIFENELKNLNTPTDDTDVATKEYVDAYAKLDGTNQPFTGNLNISKADPEIRLTDTGNSEYSRWTRTDTDNAMVIKNRISYSQTAYGVNVTACSAVLPFAKTGSYTLAYWIYVNGGSGVTMMEAGGSSPGIDNYSNVYSGNSNKGSISLGTGAWKHVMQTYDSGTTAFKVYVNGSIVINTTGSVDNWAVNKFYPFSRGGKERFVNARFDEFAIWNTALVASDASDMYNAGNGFYLVPASTFPTSGSTIGTNLMALYHFDEGSGTTAIDSSGNSRNMTMGGSFTYITGKVPSSSELLETDILSNQNSSDMAELGILKLGYYNTGLLMGTKTILEGKTTRFNVNGSEKIQLASTGLNTIDNFAHNFGTANDASITFDGDSLNIKSNLVTATDGLELTGGTAGIKFFIGSTEQVTLTDGALSPKTTNDIDLGTSSLLYKILYLEGNAIIDSDTAGLQLGEDQDVLISSNANGVINIASANPTTTDIATNWGIGATNVGVLTWMEDEDYFKFSDDVMMLGGENIILDTTTGTKIGTATSQKLGFYNATPVVQQTGVATQKTDYTAGDLDTEDEIITALNTTNTAINTLRTALNNLGLTSTI
jgi:hypothetical protein